MPRVVIDIDDLATALNEGDAVQTEVMYDKYARPLTIKFDPEESAFILFDERDRQVGELPHNHYMDALEKGMQGVPAWWRTQ